MTVGWEGVALHHADTPWRLDWLNGCCANLAHQTIQASNGQGIMESRGDGEGRRSITLEQVGLVHFASRSGISSSSVNVHIDASNWRRMERRRPEVFFARFNFRI